MGCPGPTPSQSGHPRSFSSSLVHETIAKLGGGGGGEGSGHPAKFLVGKRLWNVQIPLPLLWRWGWGVVEIDSVVTIATTVVQYFDR